MPSHLHSPGPEPSQRTLAVVMAGGNGTRLGDLTRWHSKPALPFGGQYRNIDFPLSNCVNSGIRRIALATQYKAHSLIQHVHLGWDFLRPEVGEFVELWPAQQRCGDQWYAGTADAIYQNLDLIDEHAPDYVLVLAGDHVYKMDYRHMLDEHVAKGANLTIGCVEVPVESASAFGIMGCDAQGWVTRFDEKPVVPSSCLGDSSVALASMGIYVFNREFLVDCLRRDAADARSRHDFGRNILPLLIAKSRVLAHTLQDPSGHGRPYWRDVGTIDSYWHASMELLTENPEFDLHDDAWPVWTHQTQAPPPIFVGAGSALRSVVAAGCRVAGRVERSVMSRNCSIGAGAKARDAVLLPGVTIGRNCRIERAVVDGGCNIPDGMHLGAEFDRDGPAREFSAEGIALITQDVVERVVAHSRTAKVAYLDRSAGAFDASVGFLSRQ
jgi:glucose-1-phosphate adenylyltransferase